MITHLARSLLFVFLIQATCPAFAEIVPELLGHGRVSFGRYMPEEAKSLADIPHPIVQKLTVHLKKRLGEAQYAHLKFAGAQLIDRKDLLKKEPGSKDYEWEIPAYIVQFDFELPGKPKIIFPAEIWLRPDASVIKEINLPAYADALDKPVFHSSKELMSIILRRGFLEKNMAYLIEHAEGDAPIKKGLFEKDLKVSLEYDKKLDTLVWVYTKILSNDGFKADMKSIYLNAYTGKVIRIRKSWSMR